MDRTNIIDDNEVARAMSLATPRKGKGKGKKKAPESHASSPSKQKSTTVPTARARAKSTTPATPSTPTRTSGARFYEANGLRIPLYNKDGLGNKRRPYARLSKGLLKYSVDDLLDMVEQYAGAEKRQELKDEGLAKSRLANWIEKKETLALGRNPKSTLSIADEEEEADDADDAVSFPAPTTPTFSSVRTPIQANTPSTTVNKKYDSPITIKDSSTSRQFSHRKRSAPDEPPDGRPHTKLQKRDALTNTAATNTGHSAEDEFTGTLVDYNIPTLSQTERQTSVYNAKGSRHDAFMQTTGMNPLDPDRSSIIIRGRNEDRVLTATSGQGYRKGETYFHETTIPHRATKPKKSPSAPYLKEGEHGRKGDFQADNDRRTGVGHQFEPDDYLKWSEFKKFHSTIYEQFPHYPKPNQGITIDLETKDSWDAWQIWYDEFTKKYPGYAVAHLWPCGCEKVRDEDESEEE
ncbi:hypothetical protein J4E90_000184 [Alternaria incomplexa]|uniref:uncharacterized protein n=1 Tax=Alternaria incomplexa TaxID=1187928 RepID=UPI00221FEED2|nr:uncharacterized protein J4E90_000184 [Alternaria incomplexa]KAI4921757.1 hypothetical protein J4E90_000184 [Alternaria incomplexa]